MRTLMLSLSLFSVSLGVAAVIKSIDLMQQAVTVVQAIP